MKREFKHPRLQNGFSVVELILVLVIVFVIGAVTAPRFALTSENTHVDRVNATANQLQNAIQEIHTLWKIQGASGSVRNLAPYAAGLIDTNALGFPIGIHDREHIAKASDCTHLWLNVLRNAPSAWHNTQTNPDYVAELENGGCRYRYRRADGISIVYQPGSGHVRVETSRS